MVHLGLHKELEKHIKKMLLALLILLFGVSLAGTSQPFVVAANTAANGAPVLLGIYPEGSITSRLIDTELHPLDTWTGKHTTLVGLNSDIEDDTTYYSTQLNLLWNNGYTPFINLTAGYFSQPTMYQIALGNYDNAIIQWANNYKSWATNGKWAYIAVLPEMNVPWVSYGRDPGNYKLGFVRIRQLFTQAGVPASAVKWVFSPNGWVQWPFEAYYPGDEWVDVVGYVSLHQGYCPNALDPYWESPDKTVGFSLKELHSMAPTKPIFITRFGVSAYDAPNHTSDFAKNQWLRDAYSYILGYPYVKAVLYYNYRQNSDCDWAIYKTTSPTISYIGYQQAVSDSHFGYLTPTQLKQADLSYHPGNQKTYLPLTFERLKQPVLLGTYSQEWIGSQFLIGSGFCVSCNISWIVRPSTNSMVMKDCASYSSMLKT